MHSRAILAIVGSTAAILGPAGPCASAAYIYVADHYDGIRVVDPDAMTIKMLVSEYVYNLAADPLGGGIYFTSGSYSGLQRYDFATKKVKFISPWGVYISGQSMTEGADDYLYFGSDKALYQVDPSTGIDTLVGFGKLGELNGDLVLSPSGVMYGNLGKGGQWEYYLVTVDAATGKQTPVVPLGKSFDGLAFTQDGRLWGSFWDSTWLYQINPVTGESWPVFDLHAEGWDMASDVTPAPASPCLLALASAACFRRRR